MFDLTQSAGGSLVQLAKIDSLTIPANFEPAPSGMRFAVVLCKRLDNHLDDQIHLLRGLASVQIFELILSLKRSVPLMMTNSLDSLSMANKVADRATHCLAVICRRYYRLDKRLDSARIILDFRRIGEKEVHYNLYWPKRQCPVVNRTV